MENKASVVSRLLAVKQKSAKSYSEIAEETGLTNVYVGQLLRRQAQLKPSTAPKLRASLPDLTDDLIQEMMTPPMRSYDPAIVNEPAIYSMSAIDFYCSVDKIKGVDGNDRVVVTFDGKYLSHSEMRAENMVSRIRLQ
ncbi:cyanate hydratase-like isoform X2 [Macadamia integrifolia]|uniref:cyanate hydratase-like isoform X2 n=1 Tax=Macadamia integrifolia TaxID=60698 RepID=UPI001C4E9D03|nr:cyanate hydratase-like isoform X2 [Macadamia integrifolia]